MDNKRSERSHYKIVNGELIPKKAYETELDAVIGEPIALQLHHINGVHNDNRLENLQILCPNCHCMTENFAGKNTNREEYKVKRIPKKRERREIPVSKEELKTLTQEFSFRRVAKMFNVSDNTIRNWCKRYGLLYRKQDM